MAVDDTINIEANRGEERELIRTGFELIIREPEGALVRHPVCYAQTNLGCPGDKPNDIELTAPEISNRQATLHFRQGQLFITNQNPSLSLQVNEQPASFRELFDGDQIRIGAYYIDVCAMADHLATLEGYSEPNRNRQWGLGTDPCAIGRRGKRVNKVELEDPTVSRVHATIRHNGGNFYLEAETESSPTRVNGERVAMGASVPLTNGDLIQVGQQLFRFRTAAGASKPRSLAAQEATILFSDIWNYSTLAENRPLEDTINQMNEFYRAMGKVIEAHGGVLMTFLGDALMAVFGADDPGPEDPVQAVAAALEMQERLVSLNASWEAAGKPTMRIGVGINTGEVMVGDVGFTGKMEFAAMGDNTNLAARLEKLTRELDASIVISGSTHHFVQSHFHTTSLGSTRVKGRQAEVEVYKVDARLGR